MRTRFGPARCCCNKGLACTFACGSKAPKTLYFTDSILGSLTLEHVGARNGVCEYQGCRIIDYPGLGIMKPARIGCRASINPAILPNYLTMGFAIQSDSSKTHDTACGKAWNRPALPEDWCENPGGIAFAQATQKLLCSVSEPWLGSITWVQVYRAPTFRLFPTGSQNPYYLYGGTACDGGVDTISVTYTLSE